MTDFTAFSLAEWGHNLLQDSAYNSNAYFNMFQKSPKNVTFGLLSSD